MCSGVISMCCIWSAAVGSGDAVPAAIMATYAAMAACNVHPLPLAAACAAAAVAVSTCVDTVMRLIRVGTLVARVGLIAMYLFHAVPLGEVIAYTSCRIAW